jgi:hypothetical protein
MEISMATLKTVHVSNKEVGVIYWHMPDWFMLHVDNFTEEEIATVQRAFEAHAKTSLKTLLLATCLGDRAPDAFEQLSHNEIKLAQRFAAYAAQQ